MARLGRTEMPREQLTTGEALEVFATEMFERGEDIHELRRRLQEAERVLAVIKGAPSLDMAKMWARSYFGEEKPF